MGKKIIYATKEKLEKVNEKNKELIRKYFVSKNMNLTESTKAGYQSDFNQWLCYILENYENKYILDMDTEDQADMLEDYVSFCVNMLQNNERRVARRISSISSLFIYLKKKRKLKENPIDLLERVSVSNDKREIKQTYLTEEQIEIIRNYLLQNKLLQLEVYFNVGLSTMARVNALSNIRIDQIDFENKRILNVLEKEQRVVTLFLSTVAIESINKWLEYRKRNNIESEYLFINTTKKDMGKQISKSTIQSKWIKDIGAVIGVPELHSHDLRHSYASLLRKKGVPLETVSKCLNHLSTDITLKFYIETDYDSIQGEKENFDI